MSVARIQSEYAKGCWIAQWASILNGETGDRADIPLLNATRSVQVAGTLGIGGSVSIEGSNDGTNYVTLTDSTGVALTFTAVGIKDILQNVRFLRPHVTAGDGATNFLVTILAV